MKSSAGYRIWQFFQSLRRPPSNEAWAEVESILNRAEIDLFHKLPSPDQNHSLRVFFTLKDQGEDDPDLLKAALMHDIGKIKYPLKRWERVFAVLLNRFFPKQSQSMAWGEPVGLKKPLVVIEQHPAWGADYAEQAGSSPTAVWLIRHHENMSPEGNSSHKETLLHKLQLADNQN
jgi:hypothetical protein